MSIESVVAINSFIDAVRKRPCLWDLNHIAFKNSNRRERAFELVAKECGMASAYEAKCHWKRLRDSHREALRRRHHTQDMKPWKYEEEMKFLVKDQKEKETITFYTSDFAEESAQEDDTKPTTVESVMSSPSPSEHDFNKGQAELLEEKRKEQNYLMIDNMRSQAMDTDYASQDALSMLFDSLCQKTRCLPNYLQLRVQREVFESVLKAEEEALASDPLAVCYRPSSSTAVNGQRSVTESKKNILSQTQQRNLS